MARDGGLLDPDLRRSARGLVGHRDRLAEMGDRLLERRPAQGLNARSSPPLNRRFFEPGLSEMMSNDLGLSRGALWIVAQQFGGTAVQRLTAALEQAVVSRILDQRVLEAIVGLRGRALDEQEVGVGEPVQRPLQHGIVELGDVT